MARFAVGVLFGIVVGSTLGAALSLHADDVQAEVQEAAAAAHVDPVRLQGAVNTTGLDPYLYLRGVGELDPPPAPRPVSSPEPPAAVVSSRSGLWQRLAACESNGNWHANTGNGFFGGTQTLQATWIANGGLGFAPRADLATPAQQIAVNERILASDGWSQWPSCSRRLGLR